MTNERGSCELMQRGRQTRLLPGELTVLYAHEPYRLECAREHRTQVLCVPGRELDHVLDSHIGIARRGEEAQLLADFISRLAHLDSRYRPSANLLDTALGLI